MKEKKRYYVMVHEGRADVLDRKQYSPKVASFYDFDIEARAEAECARLNKEEGAT